MRTTLDIDPDVLQLAKELAAKERKSTGAKLSELARAGFHAATAHRRGEQQRWRNGADLLPSRGETITMEHVRRLIDENDGR